MWTMLLKPLMGVATNAISGYVETKKIKGETKIAEIKTIKQRLVDQIDNSVMFYDQILNIENIAKPEKWYHIGPGNVTAGMVKKSISSESIEIINSLDSLNNI